MALIKGSASVLEKIQLQNTMCLNVMKSTAKNLFNLIWSPSAGTPQDVCDALGVEAAKAFEAHGKLQELIYLVDPSWVPLVPPSAYLANEDGTVTIQEAE